MKIAIPVNDKSIEGSICQSFGRAPYFLIYNTETQKGKFLENTALKSQGGAGIKAAQIIVDSGADSIITSRCGKNAADVMAIAKIKIYKSRGDSINENVEAQINGKLSLLDEIHSGFHNNGE